MMRQLRSPSSLCLIIAILLWTASASAHLLKLSDSELDWQGSRAVWKLRVHLADFDQFFRGAEEESVRGFLNRRLSLASAGGPCRLDKFSYSRDESQELWRGTLEFSCPNDQPPLQIDYHLFFGDLNHRHLLKLNAFGRTFSNSFSPDHSAAAFSPEAFWPTFRDFLRLGIEHILTGYDHILFVLTLILGVRRFRSLLCMVSAFTLAHSISLALSTLDLVTLSPRIVEPLIAASIVFLAIQDLLAKGEGNFRLMVALTFGFGLIHGLGFSYVLREANLQHGNLLLPLFAFNLGVEIGQVSIVALVFPLTLGLDHWLKNSYVYLKKGALVAIGSVGAYWMMVRLLGVSVG